MRGDAEIAKATARTGEQRIEAMQAEVTYALKSIEDLKQGLTSAGQAAVIARREAEQAKKAVQNAGENVASSDQVSAVFQQLLGLAGNRTHKRESKVLPAVKRESKIERAPRHGFDDATQPMAVLTLEGRFRELNPAFTKLVGYKEPDFLKAAWPSPHDRRDYQEQQDQLRQLASGEVESVPVQSTYMHGQGLMVPVVGKLTAVPGEDGLPVHLLLEAEERHTS
jgi:PAS domain S-box-containing protein